MIDILSGSMVLRFKKSKDKNGVCVYFNETDAHTYVISVHYEDDTQTHDEFKTFKDAFDSFTNIVKTLLKEEDWHERTDIC